MTVPDPRCVDPAAEVVDAALAALSEVFDPESVCPPKGGGSSTVRLIVSDDGGLPYWDGNCKGGPFLWVRAAQRFRSTKRDFPAAVVKDIEPNRESPLIRVVSLELGAARCSVAGPEVSPSWDKLHDEAVVALDDSWRLETALQGLVCRLRSPSRAVAVDSIAPVGPDGGIVAVTGMVFVQFGERLCCGA